MNSIRRDDRVLITGASSGIGKELARQLGTRGCRLALTGRRRGKLVKACETAQEAGAKEVLMLCGTVTDQEVVRGHYEMIAHQWDGLDCAILNAGVGDSESARQFSAANYRWTFETNVFGMCHWLEQVIPTMVANRKGLIVGVSSPAGWCGLPNTGSYCASKAAVSTMLESVRVDLRGTGVDVVIVCPGFVKSEITARNDPKDMVMLLETEDGVGLMLKGIDRRKRVVHFPFPVTTFVRYGLGRMPRGWYDALVTRFVRRNKRAYVDESASEAGSASGSGEGDGESL